jgi:hypothetical protein
MTGCALLAVKTSSSKFPSFTARMLLSAMFFVLKGLPKQAPFALLNQFN